jgi:hypothetical protein
MDLLMERARLTDAETEMLRDIATEHAPTDTRCRARCTGGRRICTAYAEATGTLRAHGLWPDVADHPIDGRLSTG